MLSAKLNMYSTDDCRALQKVISESLNAIKDLSISNCKLQTGDCKTCKIRHACYDLYKLTDYLNAEVAYGHPHCKK